MKRPLIPSVVFVVAGLLTAHLDIVSLTFVLIIASLCLPLLILAFFYNKKTYATLCSFILFWALGFILLYPYTPRVHSMSAISSFIKKRPVNIEGIIDSTPVISQFRTKLYLRVIHIHEKERSYDLSSRVMVSIKETSQKFHYGDRIRFFCTLRAPKNFQNPGGFDYERYLAN